MSEQSLTVSVVICAYTDHRWDDLMAAVESVQRQTVAPDDIIVVVDHHPALLTTARSCLQQVRVIENTERRGLSGARNSGVAAAHGSIVAFLDDDAIAQPEWLARLVAAYADINVLGVGGAIVPRWPQTKPLWFPDEFNWVVGCTFRGMPTTSTTVRNLIGCNMSFRRQTLVDLGGFRSEIGRVGTLPIGCEETELCIRARQRWPQKHLLYTPQAVVEHRVTSSRARWRYFRARCYAEGLSKATIAQLVGVRDALSVERAYTTRTLPIGILHGITAPIINHDPTGLVRASAIIAGLSLTAAGYLTGRMRGWFVRQSAGTRATDGAAGSIAA